MVRILHVGLGPLGQKVLHDFFDRGMGDVVGAVDSSPEIAGRDLAEIVPAAGDGPRVVASLDELEDTGDVNAAIVTTSSSLEACAETFEALLARGVNVISSCEELLYPWLRHPILAQGLQERAVKGGCRILGTGVNPGFVMDLLPVVATGVSRSVRSMTIRRIQDATTRRVPFQRKIGAGLDADAFEAKRAEGTLRHVGLGESLHFVAHYLGWKLERWEETLEPVIAERELECALGTIRPGDASGVRQVADGWRDGERVLRLEFQAAIGQPDPYDGVTIDGEPPIDLRLEGGVHGDVATSAMLLNSIGALREAEPGLHTMASIRPPRCQVTER